MSSTTQPHRAPFADLDRRWSLLAGPDPVMVRVTALHQAIDSVLALPPGSSVVLAGRRHLRTVARRTDLQVRDEYLVLPSLETPVVIASLSRPALEYTTRSLLTVSPGISRLHLPAWIAIRTVRGLPWLLPWIPMGDRLLMGERR